MSDLREVAHAYQDRGWAVLLLAVDGSGGKIPPRNCDECNWREPTYRKHLARDCDHLLCHGFYAATKDPDRFDKMLAALPTGQLAVRTGRVSRLLVIDAEAHARVGEPSGLKVLEQWQTYAGVDWDLPVTLTSKSVSGGLHLYYEIPADVEVTSHRVLPGVDVKAENGYVGAVSGQTARTWVAESMPVVAAPPELLEWLKERHGGFGSGGASGTRPDGYDYKKFLAEGCPDGYRDYFFNELAFRLRKDGVPRDEYEQCIWEEWTRCAQPPNARYEMPWDNVAYKLERVWTVVEPSAPPAGLEWAKSVISNVSHVSGAADDSAGVGVGVGGAGVGADGGGGGGGGGLRVGALDPARWYGTHDDGFAERMRDVWGDWFRAIPNKRGGHTWLYFDGVTWHEDTRGQIWLAAAYVVELLRRVELETWERRCRELAEEGVDDWRTELVAGGQNAGEFQVVVALRKFEKACRENTRKQSGVTAFARLSKISIAESDLDAQTRYVALGVATGDDALDGRVIDVQAVHEDRPRSEWLVLARPEMLITKKLGCGYQPALYGVDGTAYDGSLFKKYLEGVLPDVEVRDTLQEIVGYALLGDPLEKIVVLLHGPPDSGKTVLLEILEALLGDYGGWADSSALTAGKAKSAHSEWLHKLRGLRLIVTPETAKGAKIDAAWMKSYTGREPQTSRGAYGDRSVTWKPSGIIFNASNHYLEYDAEDTAVAERTQVIEFEQRFQRGDKRRDEQLPQKIIKSELPIVLNWALEGLRRHGARAYDILNEPVSESGGEGSGDGETGEMTGAIVIGRSDVPLRAPTIQVASKIQDWSKRYRTAQDHVGQFVRDAEEHGLVEHVPQVVSEPYGELEPPTSHYAPLKIVFLLYKTWCAEQQLKPLGRNVFNDHLRSVYGWKSDKSGGHRWIGVVCHINSPLDAQNPDRWG